MGFHGWSGGANDHGSRPCGGTGCAPGGIIGMRICVFAHAKTPSGVRMLSGFSGIRMLSCRFEPERPICAIRGIEAKAAR